MLKIVAAVFVLALPVSSLADDWQVTTPQWKKTLYKNQVRYGGIKTQEAFDREFKKAFEKGDTAAVKFLAGVAKRNKLEFDVNEEDEKGQTLLHKSASRPSASMSAALLELGADATVEDEFGNQPLHVAVKSMSTKNVDVLLRAKDVDVNAQNKMGERPIGLAVAAGSLGNAQNDAMIREIMERKPDLDFKINGTEFREWVIQKDNVSGLKLFYPKVEKKGFSKDPEAAELMHAAAKYDSARIVGYLMDKGVSGRATTKTSSKPAFEVALMNGHNRTIRVFVDRDRKLGSFRQAASGDSIAHFAVDTGNFELLDFVVKNKLPLGLKNNNGERPIDILRRVRDFFDPDTAKLFAKYEPLLAKQAEAERKAEEKLAKRKDAAWEKALRTDNPAPIMAYIEGVDREQAFAILAMIGKEDEPKPRLLKALLKTHKSEFKAAGGRAFFEKSLYSSQNFELFKAMWEVLGHEAFYTCDIESPPMSMLMGNADVAFLKKAFKLKPPIDLQAKSSCSEASAMEILEVQIQNRRALVSSVNDPALKADLERSLDRSIELRDYLKKAGYLTKAQLADLNYEFRQEINKGSGADFLKKQSPRVISLLAQSENTPELAVFKGDVESAAILLDAMSKEARAKGSWLPGSPKMEALLAKKRIKLPQKFACVESLLTFGSEMGFGKVGEWLKTNGISRCSETPQAVYQGLLSNMMVAGYGPFKDFMSIPEFKGFINTVTLPGLGRGDKVKAIHMAAGEGVSYPKCDPDIFNELLKMGADVNAQAYIRNGTEFIGVLGILTQTNCEESRRAALLDVSLKAGAEIEGTSDERISPLARAVKHSDFTSFKTLLDAGASLAPRNHDSLSVPELLAVSRPYRRESDFWTEIEKKKLSPVVVRQCIRAPNKFQDSYRGPKIINARVHNFEKAKRDEERASVSCENVKATVKAEYTAAVLAFVSDVDKWLELAGWYFGPRTRDQFEKVAAKEGFPIDFTPVRHGFAAQHSLCCSYSSLQRCLDQFVCEKNAALKKVTKPYCDRFMDREYTESLGLVLEFDRNNYIADATRHGSLPGYEFSGLATVLLRGENGTYLRLTVPSKVRALDDKKKLDAKTRRALIAKFVALQRNQAFKDMKLATLGDYVRWKYPSCASSIVGADKIAFDAVIKRAKPVKKASEGSGDDRAKGIDLRD